MTDKKPEPLSLADEADTADDAGHTTARKANAYYLCLLSDCSQMIRRLHAEIETLRMDYAAARLEIALRKEHADELAVAYMCGASQEKELAAPQPGAAYAALPDERAAFEAWYCDQMRAAGYNADEGIADLREGNHYGEHRVMLNGKWEGWQARASHGQALTVTIKSSREHKT